MITTDNIQGRSRPLDRVTRFSGLPAILCLGCVALFALTGCSSAGQGTGASAGSSNATSPLGTHMAGPAIDVHVSPEAIATRPAPWVLTTPQSAVRSYLDWTSYAYRIGSSDVARPTMSPDEAVRVDSYNQYNVENKKLIDQTLTSITFGKPSVGSTSTLVPAHETWTYRYVSIQTAGKTIAGPYTASYDSAYTVVKSKNGDWTVVSVQATPHGRVK